MTVPPAVERFLAAVEKLPEWEGLAFRGLDATGAPAAALVTQGLNAFTRRPGVALGGSSPVSLAALVMRTGRDISGLSAKPDEQEVLLLPGAVLLPIVRLTALGLDVHVLEQVVPDRPAPDKKPLEELLMWVQGALEGVTPVPPLTPGKFTGPLA